MAAASAIEWTDATWNPIRARNLVTGKLGWHCTHASEGCRNCYAETFNRRLGTGLDFKPQSLAFPRAPLPPAGGGSALRADRGDAARAAVFLDETMLTAPLRWRKPRRIFVGSMSDLFGEFVPDAWIDQVFAVMALAPHHTFQVLTKRSARMREYATTHFGRLADVIMALRASELGARFNVGPNALGPLPHVKPGAPWWPLENVWLGVSAEDQPTADERLRDLVQTPAAVRFLSGEPLLGGTDVAWALSRNPIEIAAGFLKRGHFSPGLETLGRVHWVIAGGESGPAARPMHPAWPRQLRDACAAAGTAFFFKQWGEWAPDDGPPPPPRLDPPRLALWWRGDGCWTYPEDLSPLEHPGVREDDILLRYGKRAAGRLLDGVEHNAMPKPH